MTPSAAAPYGFVFINGIAIRKDMTNPVITPAATTVIAWPGGKRTSIKKPGTSDHAAPKHAPATQSRIATILRL
jgi:hypothetical protein